MNKNLKRLLEPGTRLCFAFLVVFAGIEFVFNIKLAIAEMAVVVLLMVYFIVVNRRRRKGF